jgi:hypothetical protein
MRRTTTSPSSAVWTMASPCAELALASASSAESNAGTERREPRDPDAVGPAPQRQVGTDADAGVRQRLAVRVDDDDAQRGRGTQHDVLRRRARALRHERRDVVADRGDAQRRTGIRDEGVDHSIRPARRADGLVVQRRIQPRAEDRARRVIDDAHADAPRGLEHEVADVAPALEVTRELAADASAIRMGRGDHDALDARQRLAVSVRQPEREAPALVGDDAQAVRTGLVVGERERYGSIRHGDAGAVDDAPAQRGILAQPQYDAFGGRDDVECPLRRVEFDAVAHRLGRSDAHADAVRQSKQRECATRARDALQLGLECTRSTERLQHVRTQLGGVRDRSVEDGGEHDRLRRQAPVDEHVARHRRAARQREFDASTRREFRGQSRDEQVLRRDEDVGRAGQRAERDHTVVRIGSISDEDSVLRDSDADVACDRAVG